MFWISKNPKDKQHVFKVYFPYYIIIFFGLCLTAIITSKGDSSMICFCTVVYLLALIIWRYIIKQKPRVYRTIKENNELQNPNLP
ncbi:hypothetical protein [Winogradskyella sp.]|uniref:hypothetical protein n=1 Tax=Winogradskyella sp. TaxID=1883156 RepID=UPI0025D38A22|nr:hypothetical protein [Winogradskyella sp.]